MVVREYTEKDLPEIIKIWNEVVEDGIAFPQEELLDMKSGEEFFASQSFTGVAEEDGKIYGLYILHPNNVGRCGHICNASYAVSSDARGRHIGEQLVKDCLKKGKELGFGVLQFDSAFCLLTLTLKIPFVPLLFWFHVTNLSFFSFFYFTLTK